MQFTLIIPAWNEAHYLPATLAHAQAAIDACSYSGRLVVVDNNSSDNTAEVARSAGATVVFEPINQIASARNAGAAIATSEALVFLDADTTLTDVLLQSAMDALVHDTVVAGGVPVELDTTPRQSAARVVSFWNWVSGKFQLAAGSFIFCRRDAFEAVGGFDTRLYAAEEIVLSRRLKRWGRKNGYSFRVLVDQSIVTSSRKLEWYSTPQLIAQALLVLIPGALYSKRLCRTWYDGGVKRK